MFTKQTVRDRLQSSGWKAGGEYLADYISTHCGQVTPYGDIDLSQHWSRCLITWNNFDYIWAKSYGIQLGHFPRQCPICIFLISIYSCLQPHLPCANDFNYQGPGDITYPMSNIISCTNHWKQKRKQSSFLWTVPESILTQSFDTTITMTSY